jgi:hypothetical protein
MLKSALQELLQDLHMGKTGQLAYRSVELAELAFAE